MLHWPKRTDRTRIFGGTAQKVAADGKEDCRLSLPCHWKSCLSTGAAERPLGEQTASWRLH